MDENIWIFGYGSLVWRPGFDFLDSRIGYIEGWKRFFYQGSPDHRGTEESPGRVATLLPKPESKCWGVAYQISSTAFHTTFSYLDHREKCGFHRYEMKFHCRKNVACKVYTYVASEENPCYLGPASMQEMAEQIHYCKGPSGTNSEYLLELAASLRSLGVVDDHVFELEKHLQKIQQRP
ncbi:gamma-glutamylcyclotransferase [Candidatus Uabimicrobium amorphum]|uniref:glutathione-specific gamma-glutamylcyclotransferase n=1 Tax=Uabimicrobium amorphum TaxID=2596890 RepID=A0A5S9F6Q8_UABAM|nr:gamma-glutamylcyclotransferase [Candidatus Uabimicrobium amorphum]BBM86949.1 gamma-glutamylcyclotransferase [Candidatus Uabimicrobium amorphum]